MFTIELAVKGDVPRILELSNLAAEQGAANFATSPEPLEEWELAWEETRRLHPWLVARSGAVIGFARSSPHRSRGAYAWSAEMAVYIDPEHRGHGVGTALYGALIPLLRAQGYMTLLAGITDGHTASERLHARMGFVRCGTFHRIGYKLDRWLHVGYWEMHLQPPDHVPGRLRPVEEVWR
ncbi:MAG: N-acetyltransferase [Deltaproteobacteria bacterium]|nr:N-acetyltransferase [Deltaproteobacteria bacterium]